jgi:hypothetical protein
MTIRHLILLVSLSACSVCLAGPTVYYDLWRNTTDDVASAACIKMGLTDVDIPYHDVPPAAGEYFYWVRAIDTGERESNPVGDTVYDPTCGTAGVDASVRLIYPTAASDTYPTSRVPVRLELWAYNLYGCGAEWDFEILLYEDDLSDEELIATWTVTKAVSPSFTPHLIASSWLLEDLWQYEDYVPVLHETLQLGARIRFAGETQSETTAPMDVALLGTVVGPALDALLGTTGVDLAWTPVSENTGYSNVASVIWTFDDCNNNDVPDESEIDSDDDGVIDDCDDCPATIPSATVDEYGCPPVVLGDSDRDGDNDLRDAAKFQHCLIRAIQPTAPSSLISTATESWIRMTGPA